MSSWQFFCKSVKERGSQILESGRWTDCTFVVGQEKTRFYTHKLFLSMATPVFDCMVNGPMADDCTIIPDVRPEAFRTMLEYIYTDKINISDCDHAYDLYYCANKYMLHHLLEGCIRYLQENLTHQNACQIYDFARMYDETELSNECIEMILLKTKDLLNDPSFVETKLSTFKEILKFNVLNIDNELDLYFAVENYSKNHKKEEDLEPNSIQDDQITSNLPDSTNDDFPGFENENSSSTNWYSHLEDINKETREENNKLFRSLIPEVRLLTLTPQEFADNVALSPFITKAESYALLMNIASNKTTVSIPKGFNTSYKHRYKLETNPERNLDIGLYRNKERSETTFQFVVENFSENMLMSLPFYVRGLSWRVAVNPKAKSNGDDQKYVGIFLYCCWVNKNTQWTCPAKAEINLISNKSNAVHLVRSIEHVFTSKENNRGSQVPFETILDPKYGYLKDNVLTIEVHIVADEPTNASSKPQIVKSHCLNINAAENP